MKLLMNKRSVIAVLTVACLTTVLLTVTPIRSGSPGAGEYDAWLDWNDDSKIDMKDIGRVAKAFGTNGTSIGKASIEYESDWIDITDKCGQNVIITHNLNSTDLIVDIQGKTTLESGPHQRNYGLTGEMQGWNKTYGGTGYDYAEALVQTTDGGYALAGYTDSFGAVGYPNSWLVKTDNLGTMQWNKTFGGDVAWALVQTSDGGYALAGESNLLKVDADGNLQWANSYDGIAYALVQTSDGGYALAGSNDSTAIGNGDFWLVKTDGSGNMMWNKTYGGTDYEGAYALVQTSDGGYALAGYTVSFGAGSTDAWLVRTDANGNMMWNKTYGGTWGDGAFALVQTSDGGYALGGTTGSSGPADFWLVKTDGSGNMMWNQTYGGTLGDNAYALVQTNDGGYALAGKTLSFSGYNYDFWLVKTDANGNMQWNRTYGGIGDDRASALAKTADGGYALAGVTNSFGAGKADLWLVKTDLGSGLAWIDSSANTVTLYRGATDTYWNYVRVRLWKPR